MVEFVTLTGEITDGLVGCSSYGRNFFARPVFNTAFQSIPSQNWLDKFKTQFFGVVIYENQRNNHEYDRPLFIGVTPINIAAYQGENVTDKHKIQTTQFQIVVDDMAQTLSIVSSKVSVLIENETGLVTIKNGTYSLGKVLTDMMNTYMKTKTIDMKPLSPDSISSALDNIVEIQTLLK